MSTDNKILISQAFDAYVEHISAFVSENIGSAGINTAQEIAQKWTHIATPCAKEASDILAQTSNFIINNQDVYFSKLAIYHGFSMKVAYYLAPYFANLNNSSLEDASKMLAKYFYEDSRIAKTIKSLIELKKNPGKKPKKYNPNHLKSRNIAKEFAAEQNRIHHLPTKNGANGKKR